jgi:hypothetical protein
MRAGIHVIRVDGVCWSSGWSGAGPIRVISDNPPPAQERRWMMWTGRPRGVEGRQDLNLIFAWLRRLARLNC